MGESPRVSRIAKRIMVLAATTIEHQVKDPTLDMVTITSVRVTGDLREATVYYTALGKTPDDPVNLAAIAACLEKYKGQIRTAVGKAMSIRHTPSLQFVYDTSLETSQTVDALLETARLRDEQMRQARGDAQPIGDPHPYKSMGSVESSSSYPSH